MHSEALERLSHVVIKVGAVWEKLNCLVKGVKGLEELLKSQYRMPFIHVHRCLRPRNTSRKSV